MPRLVSRSILGGPFRTAFTRAPFVIRMLLVFTEQELKTIGLMDRLGSIECTTLVMASADDPITPALDEEEILAALQSRLGRFERLISIL